MQISVARPSELGPDEFAAWRSMQKQTPSLASPFLCPEFAVAVDNCRDDARVAVLTEGRDIVGFFPFERHRFGHGVPICGRLSDCNGLVHAPSLTWDSRELLRACKLAMWKFDNLVDGQRGFEGDAVTTVPSAVIDLADGFAVYHDKLRVKSPQFCRNMARKTRNLEREAGELRFEIDSRDVADLRTLIGWKSDQYRRSGWTDIFGRRWVADLIDYLFATHADGFGGLLSVLYAGEAPVAAHFGLRSSHVLTDWFPAYDTRFGKRSPGIIQIMKMAAEAAGLGIERIDMGTGDERYKKTLRSYDMFVSRGMVVRSPLQANVYRLSSAVTSWTRRQVRQRPPLARAADRLLRATVG